MPGFMLPGLLAFVSRDDNNGRIPPYGELKVSGVEAGRLSAASVQFWAMSWCLSKINS